MSFTDLDATSDKAAAQKTSARRVSPGIAGDYIAPQSQVHCRHAPSSRLVGGPILAKQQYL